jgi:biotin carboxylase
MHILIVGHVRYCHERLHAEGHRTVLFMPRDRIQEEDLKLPHEAIISLPANATSSEIVGIAAAMHAAEPFDAVVSYTDSYQHIASEIAQSLQVHCVVDPEVVRTAVDKYSMRKVLARAGVPQCRFAFARGRAEIVDAVREVGMPCIVKPVAGKASIGIAKIEAQQDIEKALDWVGAKHVDQGVVVEQFMEGPEFSVEAISVNGEHRMVALTMKYKDPETFVEIGHVIPAPVEVSVKVSIEDYVGNALTALGFKNLPSHTEIILTPEGPRIVETHTRLAGDHIIDLARYSCNVDLYTLSARQSIGMDISDLIPAPIIPARAAAIWYASPSSTAEQILVDVAGIEQARSVPGVEALEILKRTGEPGGMVTHSHDRVAYAIALSDNAAQALAASQAAIGQLSFLYSVKSGQV